MLMHIHTVVEVMMARGVGRGGGGGEKGSEGGRGEHILNIAVAGAQSCSTNVVIVGSV